MKWDLIKNAPGRGVLSVVDWSFNPYYYRVRYMNPVAGPFIVLYRFDGHLRQHSYVGNNPVNRVDPTGMWDEPSGGKFLSQFTDNGFKIESADSMDSWFAESREFTQKQKAVQAINDAKQYCEEKAATSGNEQTRKYYKAMADWLGEVLNNHLWSIEDPENNPKSEMKNKKAVTEIEVYTDPETGKFAGADLFINKKFINDDYPKEFLTSYIIGEAATETNAQDHIQDITSIDSYKKASESFGWTFQLQYMAFHVDLYRQANYPSANWWYDTIRNFYKYGYPRALEEILRNYGF